MPVSDKLPYSVVDNKLTIDSIRTNAIDGEISLNGSLKVQSDSNFEKSLLVGTDLIVGRELRVPVLHVDTLISKTQIEHKEPVSFAFDSGGVEGKGFVWKKDKKNIDFFIYKSDPNRVFTNIDIELYRGNSYRIDGTPVLTVDTLGSSVINSSIRKLGRLKDLIVDGDTIIGEHIFFDATSTRLGIGTDHANAAFSLVDNGIEIVLGNVNETQGNIGTFTSHDLGIVTDNTTRMKVTKGGKVIFGDEIANNADVSVFGKLYVKELIVDQRNEKTGPLEFKALPGATNYGRGMLFTGNGINKQFVFGANPDQFFSTEHINLQQGRSYHIENQPVLSFDSLGPSVTKSCLAELGNLNHLTVLGDINLSNVFQIKNQKIHLGTGEILTDNGITISSSNIELKAENQSLKITTDSVVLGSKDRPMVNAIVNGKLSVGIQSVGDNAQFEVGGNIRFADKLFMTGSKAPSTGTFKKGDIVWNNDPKETGYVGWVCVRDGNPGIWRGFGQIGVE